MKKNQVKVTKTEPYKDFQAETIVCKGKLMLIKPDGLSNRGSLSDEPMIISETESIEVGDNWINTSDTTLGVRIATKNDIKAIAEKSAIHCCKILALPENFSPKHLHAIADGKLKDGDEVLVECNEFLNSSTHEHWFYEIDFNKDNHITLFPVKRTNRMIDKLDIYSGDLNVERIKAYKELAKAYNIPDGTVRDIFCKGAEWVIDVSERI